MITLKNIKKTFANHTVIQDFSLEIKDGETLCLAGASGLGKTTILEIIAGLLPPTSGTCTNTHKQIGYVFQDNCLLPWKNLEENITFALTGTKIPKKEHTTIAQKWLKKLQLQNDAKKYPHQISGGMKRRLNIARSLAITPKLLLLDEPFAFLDQTSCQIIQQLLKELSQTGITIILISHVIKYANDLNAKIIQLKTAPIIYPPHA